ncbi:MAG TPA: GerMN domain-containing protein [Mycobacteriales bacterium]|nr:GerMN domain-containing protein [Mycobacteriales bacterium]
MSRIRRTRTAAALVGTALVLTGCNSGTADEQRADADPSGSPTASSESPVGEPGSTPTAVASEAPGTATAAIYYLVDTSRGPRLQREFRQVSRSTTPIHASVDAMLHLAPLDRDYTSLWPKATKLRAIDVDADLATVDLSGDAAKGNSGAAFEATSLQQLVYTVTAADPTVKRVQLLIDGKPRETLWGHATADEPMPRASHIETLAPVSISTPNEDSTVGGTFTISGTATVFEANVQWKVTRGCPADVTCVGEKPVYRSGFVTASAGAPARGTWSVKVTVPEEVFETSGYVEITAFEESMEDGSLAFSDTKVVRVTR